MRNQAYSNEAKYCRELAADFLEGSEKPFLLRVADAFDDLAAQNLYCPDEVIGPLGELLTLDNLPAVNTVRWTPRRKAEVVAAVAGGLLTLAEACERYSVTAEEFTGWQRRVDHGGLRGLRVTRTQDDRDSNDRRTLFETNRKM